MTSEVDVIVQKDIINMKVSLKCLEDLKLHEGFRSKAYLDGGGIPTIGYGSTYYKDNSKVKMGDIISEPNALELFKDIVSNRFEIGVTKLLKRTIKQNEFDALVSFAYNIGLKGLSESTLLKIINDDRYFDKKQYSILDLGFNDSILKRVKVEYSTLSLIKGNFIKWSFDNGKFVEGLYTRRKKEADIYEGI